MKARLRVAVVGVGDVASRDYLPEFPRIGDRAEIVAVCGAGNLRARAVGESLGVGWFTDFERLLSTVEVDVVLNLTPIQSHYAVSLKALSAGKHVYTEKPMATTLTEALRLRKSAADAGLVLVAAPSVLLFPQVALARRLLKEGTIGEVRGARGVMLAGVPPWPGYPSDPSQFFSPGGGPLVDMGIYAISAITGLLGPVTRVTAVSARVGEGFVIDAGGKAESRVAMEVDDQWVVVLELESGAMATVEANFTTAASYAPVLEFMGSGGSIAIDPLDVSAPLRIMDGDGLQEIPIPEPGRVSGPDHILGVEDLVASLMTGEQPVLSPDHAVYCIGILQACARSAAERKAIRMDEANTGMGAVDGREAR